MLIPGLEFGGDMLSKSVREGNNSIIDELRLSGGCSD